MTPQTTFAQYTLANYKDKVTTTAVQLFLIV
jgi:hypothetical protein